MSIDMDDYLSYLEYTQDGDKMLKDEPMISYDSFIDRFILDAPNNETYYFRDYEGAEDFWMLNFKEDHSTEE
jgi:hypothetical protein|tara:strand:- start:1134 stop:1349 length:216 start_codon:yes stop_codon:yes gene_type:complete